MCVDADAVEIRVLGCLIEKQRTTPDIYPLSLNALRAACNQSTNRDPVVAYDEATIRDALERLGRRRWARLAGASRAVKYRHLLDEALGLAPPELALLAVLMLRGPQTPGELRARSDRLHPFASADELEATLERLVERRLVVHPPRRPGQKEARYAQRLGADGAAAAVAPAIAMAGAGDDAGGGGAAAPAGAPAGDDARLAALEARVRGLEEEVGSLRAVIATLRDEHGTV